MAFLLSVFPDVGWIIEYSLRVAVELSLKIPIAACQIFKANFLDIASMEPQVKPAENCPLDLRSDCLRCFNGAASKTQGRSDCKLLLRASMEPQVKPAENLSRGAGRRIAVRFNGAASKTCGKLVVTQLPLQTFVASMEPQVKPAENLVRRHLVLYARLLQWSRK